MSFARHIVRKDFLRLRWSIVLWIVMMAAHFGAAKIQSMLGLLPVQVGTWMLGCVILPAIAIGLVVALQQEDPVADTDAFWITRPISWTELLGAKAGALGLLGLIAIAICVPWWIAHDFTAKQCFSGMLHTLLWHGLLVAVFVPFALIARNTGHFVLGVIVAATAVVLVSILTDFIGTTLDAHAKRWRGWGIAGLWIAMAGFVVVHQYRTRKTAVSILVMLIALLVGCVAWKRWPNPARSEPYMQVRVEWTLSAEFPPALAAFARDPGATAQEFRTQNESWLLTRTADVAASDGAGVVRDGVALRVQEVLSNDLRGITMRVSEATPNFSVPGADVLFGRRPDRELIWFALVHPEDGRVIYDSAATNEHGTPLEVGSVRYRQLDLLFAPKRAANDDFPPDPHSWIKQARLMRIVMRPTDMNAVSP